MQNLLLSSCVCFFFLPAEKRQTVLFSATQTRNVEDLARISLKETPLYVGVDDHKEVATVEGLEQVRERERERGREREREDKREGEKEEQKHRKRNRNTERGTERDREGEGE